MAVTDSHTYKHIHKHTHPTAHTHTHTHTHTHYIYTCLIAFMFCGLRLTFNTLMYFTFAKMFAFN